jgi:hypothetical protein
MPNEQEYCHHKRPELQNVRESEEEQPGVNVSELMDEMLEGENHTKKCLCFDNTHNQHKFLPWNSG